MPVRISLGDPAFETEFARFLSTKRGGNEDVAAAAADIIAQVRSEGDDALYALTRRFDGFDLNEGNMRVQPAEIAAARNHCSDADIQALELAADRIRSFHARQSPEDLDYTDDAGVRLGLRWRAIKAAGMYVPGGTAAYPSSVLMNAVPAALMARQRSPKRTPASSV
jgi:histidinol dehydrogenase